MSSTKINNEGSTRRAFFQDVTAGTAGIAVASALAQLGAPVMAAAQEPYTPSLKRLRPLSSSRILRHGQRAP